MTTAKKPAAKAANWTPADLKQLEKYDGDNSAEALGALVAGKTAAAVRSKLVSLGQYRKADPAATAAADGKAAPAKKLAIVGTIETLLGLPSDSLTSLEKAAKPELQKLAEQLVLISERNAADNGDLVAQYVATMPAEQDPQSVTVTIDGYTTEDLPTSGM